jgi:hypothetical protein
MKTVRWGTPGEVAQYEFRDGKRYTEKELRELAAKGEIRSEGGDGTPLRVGFVYVEERGKQHYDLDWTPVAPTMTSSVDDDALEWPIEPRPPV